MFTSVRRYIGFQIARFHFRRFRDKVISFTTSLSGARQVLLIMPLDRRHLLPTVMVIDLIKKRFREENITVVTGPQSVEVMRLLPRSQVIRLVGSDVTLLYLPRADALKRILRRQYDIAIDLNLDFVLPSGYICRETQARIRIGFAGRRADTFYNFQIQPDKTLGTNLLYDRVVKCLEMF